MEEWMNLIFHKAIGKYNNVISMENLFLGDSFFEYWNNPIYTDKLFYDSFKNENNLNLGVKGTNVFDWLKFITRLSLIESPKRIILNIGYNDVHSDFDLEYLYCQFDALLVGLKRMFPSSKIALITPLIGAPIFKGWEARELEWNETIKELPCDILDLNKKIGKNKEEYLYKDMMHLNNKGYQKLEELILEYIDK